MRTPPTASALTAAAGAPWPKPTRSRRHAAAGFLFAVGLSACGTAPVTPAPSAPVSIPATAPEAADAALSKATERPTAPAAIDRRPAPPAEARAAPRPRPEARPELRERPPAAEAIPLPSPTIEARPTPALPRVAREPVPQVRPGDDIVALAVEHGFDPVPVAIPEETRFSLLRIGMTKQDAEALLGRPDSSLHYANEGARIPFYASDDSSRWETFYRGQGRLMFSGAWLTGEVRLIRIEFDPEEDGQPDPDHPQRRSPGGAQ